MTYVRRWNDRKSDCACSKKLTRVGPRRSLQCGRQATHLRQDGSEKGGSCGEANFNCVTIKFGLQIEFLLNQSLRSLDLILRVCLLNNFEGDFDRDPTTAHAQTWFYQPKLRNVLEDGSGGNRGKGGARLSGHAHTAPTPSPRKEEEKGPRGGGEGRVG